MDKMGGDSILSKLVHAFFDKIEEHVTLAAFFRKSNMALVRKHFIDFLATVIGGMNGR
jgi:truncated hemoglobin YjbI